MTASNSGSALPRKRLGRTEYQLTVVGVGGVVGLVNDPAQSAGDTAAAAAREAAAIEAVQRAVGLGINFFHTAPMYAGGEAERLLGIGLRALSPADRPGLYISTEVGPNLERAHAYGAEAVHRSLEHSFETLACDRVAIVYIHDPISDDDMDRILAPGGAVEALEQLKTQGSVGAIGLAVRVHRFLRRAIESGRFDAILPSYDYTPIRNSAGPIFEMATHHDVGVISAAAYLAGLLTGIDPDVAAAARGAEKHEDLPRARALWKWAQERQLDVGAIAVQYQLHNPNIAATLVGPRTAAEVENNVRHALAPLPDGVWAELDSFISGLGPYPPGGEAQ